MCFERLSDLRFWDNKLLEISNFSIRTTHISKKVHTKNDKFCGFYIKVEKKHSHNKSDNLKKKQPPPIVNR